MALGCELRWAALACATAALLCELSAAAAQTSPRCAADTAGTMKTELFTVHLVPIEPHSGRPATNDSVVLALGREIALEYEHLASPRATDDLRKWIHLLIDSAATGDSSLQPALSASGIVELFFDARGALTRLA